LTTVDASTVAHTSTVVNIGARHLNRLQAVGATCELEWVERAGHVFYGVDPDPIADRSADFLVRHLT